MSQPGDVIDRSFEIFLCIQEVSHSQRFPVSSFDSPTITCWIEIYESRSISKWICNSFYSRLWRYLLIVCTELRYANDNEKNSVISSSLCEDDALLWYTTMWNGNMRSSSKSACVLSSNACFPIHFNRLRRIFLSFRNQNTNMQEIQFQAEHFCSTSRFRLIIYTHSSVGNWGICLLMIKGTAIPMNWNYVTAVELKVSSALSLIIYHCRVHIYETLTRTVILEKRKCTLENKAHSTLGLFGTLLLF